MYIDTWLDLDAAKAVLATLEQSNIQGIDDFLREIRDGIIDEERPREKHDPALDLETFAAHIKEHYQPALGESMADKFTRHIELYRALIDQMRAAVPTN